MGTACLIKYHLTSRRKMGPIRRYFIAGVIPFFCVFSATLIQYKIIFALGGMVNHTLVRNLSEETPLSNLSSSQDFPGTCISKTSANKLYHIGPFAWSPAVESGIISTSLIGTQTGRVGALIFCKLYSGTERLAIKPLVSI